MFIYKKKMLEWWNYCTVYSFYDAINKMTENKQIKTCAKASLLFLFKTNEFLLHRGLLKAEAHLLSRTRPVISHWLVALVSSQNIWLDLATVRSLLLSLPSLLRRDRMFNKVPLSASPHPPSLIWEAKLDKWLIQQWR